MNSCKPPDALKPQPFLPCTAMRAVLAGEICCFAVDHVGTMHGKPCQTVNGWGRSQVPFVWCKGPAWCLCTASGRIEVGTATPRTSGNWSRGLEPRDRGWQRACIIERGVALTNVRVRPAPLTGMNVVREKQVMGTEIICDGLASGDKFTIEGAIRTWTILRASGGNSGSPARFQTYLNWRFS